MTVRSSPARDTLTEPRDTLPVLGAVRDLALLLTDLALLPLPVLLTVTPAPAVVAVSAAEDRAEADLAGLSGPLGLALTGPGHTLPVTPAVGTFGSRHLQARHQPQLHLGLRVVVDPEVPAALAKQGRHGLGLGHEPPVLTEDVLHPVVLGDGGVVHVSPEDREGLAALDDGDVELVERLPGDGQLGEPELVWVEPGLDPLVGQQGLGTGGPRRVSPVIVLAWLLLLGDAVVGQVVQT